MKKILFAICLITISTFASAQKKEQPQPKPPAQPTQLPQKELTFKFTVNEIAWIVDRIKESSTVPMSEGTFMIDKINQQFRDQQPKTDSIPAKKP